MNVDYMKTLSSFSGADLQVSFGPRVVGELQQISWGIQREVAPIYTLGNPDPRSFSRGKRGVAGSLVFAVFDRDALLEELKEAWDEIAPPAMFTAKGNLLNRRTDDFASAISMSEWNKEASLMEDGTKAYGHTEPGTDGHSEIFVPPGFGVIRKGDINYADTLPPLKLVSGFRE